MSDCNVIHVNGARSWRGGEQQTLYLAAGLRNLRIKQAIIGRPGSELEKKCNESHLEFIPVKLGNELSVASALRIVKIAKERGAEILHAHTAHAHGLCLLCKIISPRLKVVVTRRVDFPAKSLSVLKYRTRLVNLFVAISHNVRKVLVADGVSETKIRLVYSGIDLNRFKKISGGAAIRKEFGFGSSVAIGSVGALVDHKDQRTLIRAYAKLPAAGLKIGGKRMPTTTLLLVGSGELLEEYTELAESLLGVPPGKQTLSGKRIIFAGFRSDVPQILSALDIFAMTSKEEGLGTSVLDAMASGLPVAATDGGGLTEMIDHEKGGLISQAQQAEALSENLVKLVMSSRLRKSYGLYNRTRVRDFDIQKTVEGYAAIYRELCADR